MTSHSILYFLLFICTIGLAQDTATSYMEKAEQHINSKEYEEAMKTLHHAIIKMPDSVELYNMRGSLLEAFQLYDKAIIDYTTAINKTKDSIILSNLLSNRGGTKCRIREFESAYNDLTEAVKFDPNNLHALNNLAAVCDEVNKPDETLKYLNQIIQVDSTYVPAYVNVGFKYQNMNNHKKAIEYLNKAIELDPKEGLSYSNRSFSRLKTNDIKGAMEDINTAIELYPTNSYAYKIRALIHIEQNNLEDACIDLNEAIELGYTNQYGDEVDELKRKHCKYIIKKI